MNNANVKKKKPSQISQRMFLGSHETVFEKVIFHKIEMETDFSCLKSCDMKRNGR